jgi:CBS domain containing-hemolysin-like protein
VILAEAATAEAGGWWGWTVLGLLSVPALVALNGFFVAAEFALVAVRKTRIEELVQQGVRRARAVEVAIDRLDRTIATTQLGITLASLALGWVGEPALARLVEPLFRALPGGWSAAATHSLAAVITFALITFMHVVFGELMPKAMALQSPDRTALWSAKALNAFARLTRPITLLMSGTSNWLLRHLGYRPATGEEAVHSVEELRLLIEDTEEAGILDADQADFVQNIFELSDKRVRDCMVPREKMAALERDTPPDKVLEAVRDGAHTRMPVYEKDLDNVVGIVNTKDLFYLFSLNGVVVLDDALYPATFLDPDETIANALRLFRRSRRPMALVRDDGGHILGLITLEDVVEEIVGDIEDEHDRPVPRVPPRRKKHPLPPALAAARGEGGKTAPLAPASGRGAGGEGPSPAPPAKMPDGSPGRTDRP